MRRLILIACIAVGGGAFGQQPFDIDASFRTNIDLVVVGSILPLEDGKLLVSGQMHFPDVSTDEALARLNPDGTRDTSFPIDQFGGGKLTPWNGKVYVKGGQIVKRSLLNGMPDPTWTQMNSFPQFISGQGGDYHVFPDGRLLFTGSHGVFDAAHGFYGQYSLVWFSNTGWLDTTRIHRQTDGAIYRIAQLPNGQFYCGGAFTQYEGVPTYALARVQPDGTLDTSFQTDIVWGQPWALLPMADGGVMVGGDFRFEGGTDTLRLMRFLPNGSLDPYFNTSHTFYSTFSSNRLSLIANIVQLGPDLFAVCGYFNRIDGEVHGGIAMFDSTGELLENYFQGSGAGPGTYMGATGSAIHGIMPTGDSTGDFWIWGSYHGYDDGTTNDTLQRMVSRLRGLDVGVQEPNGPAWQVRIFPNPETNVLHIETGAIGTTDVRVLDATGRAVLAASGPGGPLELDSGGLSKGVYLIEVSTAEGQRTVKWVKR